MTSVRRSRSWLLGGHSLEWSDRRDISIGALSDLADGLLRQALPSVLASGHGQEITDLKGRNAQDFLLPGISSSAHDEVLRLGGMAPVTAAGGALEFEPFEVSLLSPFKRFEGSAHIVHELEQHRAGPIPRWLPLRLLGYAAPLRPAFMRFGIERFRNVMSFASLGYAPQVTDSLLIDSVKGVLAIQVTSERNSRRDFNPFEEIPTFRVVAEIVRSSIGLDLQRELSASR